jgi:hypothetical protein
MPQSENLRIDEAVRQFHRASQLETLAKTEAARHRGDVLVGLQLRVFTRATATAREASRAAKEAHDSGIAAGVVDRAARAARGAADTAEDALAVIRLLLTNIDPAFQPTTAPPPLSYDTAGAEGPLTRETNAVLAAAIAEHRHDGVTAERAVRPEDLQISRDNDTIETSAPVFSER